MYDSETVILLSNDGKTIKIEKSVLIKYTRYFDFIFHDCVNSPVNINIDVSAYDIEKTFLILKSAKSGNFNLEYLRGNQILLYNFANKFEIGFLKDVTCKFIQSIFWPWKNGGLLYETFFAVTKHLFISEILPQNEEELLNGICESFQQSLNSGKEVYYNNFEEAAKQNLFLKQRFQEILFAHDGVYEHFQHPEYYGLFQLAEYLGFCMDYDFYNYGYRFIEILKE